MTKSKLVYPSFRQILRDPALFFGFGLGSGLIRPAPGTWGTVFGALLMIPLIVWSPLLAWGLLLVGLVFGSWICGQAAERMGVHDHGGIVWDEFVGIWLVLLCLPEQNWTYWLAAFVAFRVFDIVKPWPINWADRQVAGGVGIMLDDLIAALYAISIIWAFPYFLLMAF